MKLGDKVKVLVGVYAGKIGTIKSISKAPINIGVSGLAGAQMLVWFTEAEIDKEIEIAETK